jgi:hypothetical protein
LILSNGKEFSLQITSDTYKPPILWVLIFPQRYKTTEDINPATQPLLQLRLRIFQVIPPLPHTSSWQSEVKLSL